MSRLWAYLMLSGSALFWSGNFVMGRAISSQIEPITLSYLRWTVALILFLPFSITTVFKQREIIRQNIGMLVFFGVCGVAGFNTFVYLGLQHTSATNALLINSFIPILIIVLSRIFASQRISWIGVFGIMLSSAGVFTLVLRGDWNNLLSLQANRGDLWILLAALTWAVYSIGLKWRPANLKASAFLSFTMLIGVLLLSPLYWLNLLDESPFVPTRDNVMAVLYVAIFASIVAFMFWNQGVKAVGAGTAGQFIHLMPVFGTVMAVVFLSEQLYWFHAFGAAAIAAGIILTVRFKQ